MNLNGTIDIKRSLKQHIEEQNTCFVTLESNFKLVGQKFVVRCFIAVQNFKKFGRV